MKWNVGLSVLLNKLMASVNEICQQVKPTLQSSSSSSKCCPLVWMHTLNLGCHWL